MRDWSVRAEAYLKTEFGLRFGRHQLVPNQARFSTTAVDLGLVPHVRDSERLSPVLAGTGGDARRLHTPCMRLLFLRSLREAVLRGRPSNPRGRQRLTRGQRGRSSSFRHLLGRGIMRWSVSFAALARSRAGAGARRGGAAGRRRGAAPSSPTGMGRGGVVRRSPTGVS
jgi:hypothetical protein